MNMEYSIRIKLSLYTEIHDWCKELFGPSSNKTWKIIAIKEVGGWVYFGKEDDATLFKLTWL